MTSPHKEIGQPEWNRGGSRRRNVLRGLLTELEVLRGERDIVDYLYSITKTGSIYFVQASIPYFRRLMRFLALPYCYIKLVDWDECKSSKYQVLKDLLFIFFKLKYLPDNYSPCRFWEKKRSEWRYYYGSIYEPYQRGRLRREVQRKEYMIIFDDKEICYQLCRAAGLPLPRQYGLVYPKDDYVGILRAVLDKSDAGRVIIKPVRGDRGKDISIAFCKDGEIYVRDMKKTCQLSHYRLENESIIQEYINQDLAVGEIAPSVNTIRIATLYTSSNDVILLGALMRFGRGKAFLDNVSQGGIAVGIDLETGALKDVAHDSKGRIYPRHPDSGFRFGGFHIPFWSEVVEVAKRAQRNFPYYKLIGLDIAITADGPVIIEINSSHDNVGLERSSGPILRFERVRAEFRRYDLLVNKML